MQLIEHCMAVLEILNFSSRVQKYFTRSRFQHCEEKFRISAQPFNIVYINYGLYLVNPKRYFEERKSLRPKQNHYCLLSIN